MRGLASNRELWLLGALLVCFVLFHFDFTNSDDTRQRPGSALVKSAQPVDKNDATSSQSDASDFPQTRITHHAFGWTIIERLYVINGTMFIVTDKPTEVPMLKFVLSPGITIENDPEWHNRRLPTDKDIRVLTVNEADPFFKGKTPIVLPGNTFMTTDNRQFLTHYYHFVAELMFGLWRTYSALDPNIDPDGKTILPPVARWSFPHVSTKHWRDYAHMNEWIFRAAFPGAGLEFLEDWEERAAAPGRVYVYDRVILGDRIAAYEGERFVATMRTAANAFALPGSPHWWATMRANVVEFAGVFPADDDAAYKKGVITYISRQGWGRRMLREADHLALVAELEKLHTEYGYEVNIVSMDKLTREKQMRLAARTTIMMGVHGNGLTALLWMKPSQRSTVMEFFYPDGFAFDYEWTTRVLGMTHYGFWNNETFTSPGLPPMKYPEGFQGNDIPLDGKAVAKLCIERLSLIEEADD
ncbi:hypothetical protein BKA62DRAFT_713673 [Auriculariales sp. MPI-PUGE-AT-0066]|nr:hypothetical protein BKA62DRAFT_713673 [Auriculariales sp. MPI-PUGE-AT-0066]